MKSVPFLVLAWIALASNPNLALAQAAPTAQHEVVPPRLLENVEPKYPEAKRESGESAIVSLTLTVGADGHVTNAEVSQSAGAEFDTAAVDAAQLLVFAPATRDGQPMAAKIPFNFSFAIAPPSEVTPSAPTEPATAAPPPQKPIEVPATVANEAADDALEIEVAGEQPPREPTRRALEREEITKIPGTNGDALRSLTNMPGVARPPALAGMLIVRGSAPQDTNVYLDGTQIPIAYHFGGVSSVVPSELLERIDFYPGNFGPQYGRAMGGVIDVALRSPRKDRLGGLLQIDLLDARLVAEAPITKDTRFMVAGRRSWVDAWLGPAMKGAGLGVAVAPVYYDYQAMIEHDLTSKTTVRLVALGSSDRLALTVPAPDVTDPGLGGDVFRSTSFWRLQARVDTRLSSHSRWLNTLSYGGDSDHGRFGSFGLTADQHPLEARSDLRAQITPELTAVGGIDATYSRYDVSWRFPPVDLSTSASPGPLFGRPLRELKGDGSFSRPGAYAMLEVSPVHTLKFFPGVRVDYTRDTQRWTVDPRLGARYDIHADFPRTTLKGGIGVYHQPPQPYESIPPFGTSGVRSNRALHYSLGFEQELSRQVEVSVEGFYKHLGNLVRPVPAATTTENGFIYQNVGTGRTYGGEVLLRYKPDARFFGWVAYTLSRSERTDGPGQPSHAFEFDQTHILTALGSVKVGRGWQMGARFRYTTGNPYTPNIGGVMDYDAGVYSPVAGSPWSARLGAFHQLDLRVDKTWAFQAWSLTAYLDVQNSYYHKNPEGQTYNYDYSKASVLPGLPLLPILGVRGEI
jgi:TonB family protein